MITFKSIRRGSVAQWDNLQIYTCGLLMLCKFFQLLTAHILFEIWCVIRVSRPKDESSTTRLSQSQGQIALSVGGLVGAVVSWVAAGWMFLSLTIIKLMWSDGKKVKVPSGKRKKIPLAGSLLHTLKFEPDEIHQVLELIGPKDKSVCRKGESPAELAVQRDSQQLWTCAHWECSGSILPASSKRDWTTAQPRPWVYVCPTGSVCYDLGTSEWNPTTAPQVSTSLQVHICKRMCDEFCCMLTFSF